MMKLEGLSRMQISSPNATVIMGCKLSLTLSADKLKTCLRALSKAHPLINSIVTIDKQDDALLTEPKEPLISILEYENQTYTTITEKHLKDKWKLGEPLIKFIINHFEDDCQLIISCNHAICDGLSLVYLLENIAAYFQTGQIPKEEKAVQLHPDNMKNQHSKWLYKLLAYVMSSKWKKHKIKLTPQLLSKIYKAYWSKHDAKVFYLTFDYEQTKKIIETAKENKVTVNTFLTFQLYQTQSTLPPKPFKNEIFISVSLRDKLKINPDKQFGYFVSAIRMNLYKFSKGKSGILEDLQKEIKRRLNTKSLYRSLALYFFDARFFDLIQLNKFQIRHDKSIQKIVEKESDGVKTSIAITNLGLF